MRAKLEQCVADTVDGWTLGRRYTDDLAGFSQRTWCQPRLGRVYCNLRICSALRPKGEDGSVSIAVIQFFFESLRGLPLSRIMSALWGADRDRHDRHAGRDRTAGGVVDTRAKSTTVCSVARDSAEWMRTN